ncbi:MAG: glycoside hydrolase family 20 zincin-like fold domain-containing protein, partial [Alistipes sp.]|nr:glycoside hydrolase family 20 zincin-like fold domain-containing protein [Alistipes sp.]
MKRALTMFAAFVAAIIISATAFAEEPHIIPQPSYIEMHQGEFMVTPKTKIVVYDEAWTAAEVFATDMQKFFGCKKPMAYAKRGNGIKVRTDNNIAAEGYELYVQPHEIFVTGGSEAGVYYGLQTLRQMIVANNGAVPCCFIADEPS